MKSGGREYVIDGEKLSEKEWRKKKAEQAEKQKAAASESESNKSKRGNKE